MASITISVSKTAPTTEKELHSIPCKLEYTGSANIDGYFHQTNTENGSKTAGLRGHGLEGREFDVPDGYSLYILKELPQKGETKRYNVVDSKPSYTHWEWDRTVGSNSLPAKVFSTLHIANALAED